MKKKSVFKAELATEETTRAFFKLSRCSLLPTTASKPPAAASFHSRWQIWCEMESVKWNAGGTLSLFSARVLIFLFYLRLQDHTWATAINCQSLDNKSRKLAQALQKQHGTNLLSTLGEICLRPQQKTQRQTCNNKDVTNMANNKKLW